MEYKHCLPDVNQAEINPHVIPMWWNELGVLQHPYTHTQEQIQSKILRQRSEAVNCNIASDVIIDETQGEVLIGSGTQICSGVYIKGPVIIGANCMIGNQSLIRGTTYIGDHVRVGFATEIKNAIIKDNVTIGPQCFIADSKLEEHVYLGAQVRTSNHRLDRQNVSVLINGELFDTGMEKLGCLIGAHSSLGIQVIILPGRMIQCNTLIGPRVTVEHNLCSGRYLLNQQLIHLKD